MAEKVNPEFVKEVTGKDYVPYKTTTAVPGG